jgi:hypothetical protein
MQLGCHSPCDLSFRDAQTSFADQYNQSTIPRLPSTNRLDQQAKAAISAPLVRIALRVSTQERVLMIPELHLGALHQTALDLRAIPGVPADEEP